jgi:hypothetical protein
MQPVFTNQYSETLFGCFDAPGVCVYGCFCTPCLIGQSTADGGGPPPLLYDVLNAGAARPGIDSRRWRATTTARVPHARTAVPRAPRLLSFNP